MLVEVGNWKIAKAMRGNPRPKGKSRAARSDLYMIAARQTGRRHHCSVKLNLLFSHLLFLTHTGEAKLIGIRFFESEDLEIACSVLGLNAAIIRSSVLNPRSVQELTRIVTEIAECTGGMDLAEPVLRNLARIEEKAAKTGGSF